MQLFFKIIDYLMDFKKVRKFQDFCGLKETVKFDNKDQQSFLTLKESLQDEIALTTGKEVCHTNEASIEKCTKLEKPSTYKVDNWTWYFLFRFGSALGHEIFYITFIPYIFWNVDPFIGRKMVVVWVVTMYIGQALKDIIKWPRPTYPPVFKLEKRVDAEYGIPSTHAIAGTSLPFTFLLAMYGRYEFPVEFGILVACCWCLLVGLSRLYVGMHSILDVIAGIGISGAYLLLGWPFMEMVEDYAMKSAFAPWIIIMSHFLLGVFYPSSERYSTSRGDTVIILGAGAGVHCVTYWHYQYGFNFEPTGEFPLVLMVPTLSTFAIGLVRALIGVGVTVLTRFIMKSISLSLVCCAVGVSKKDRLATQRKDVEVTYKFVTYVVVAFVGTGVVPIILQSVGL